MADSGLVVVLGNRHYGVQRGWGRLPRGRSFGFISHVAVDSRGNVYAYQRSDPPVLVFDPAGDWRGGWGSGVIDDPHGIFVTPDDVILLIDRDAHQLLAFTPDGELRFTIGERHRPRFHEPFNHPADVAVAADGDIYVADGYGNSSIHRFAADGAWKQSWGRPGTGHGEFTTPHAVWVDRQDRVLVADRENNRVQLFTRDGVFLDAWGDFFHPMDIWEDEAGMIYVTDQIPRLSMLSPDGHLLGRCRPVFNGAHGLWGDGRGNIFLTDLPPFNQLTKMTPLD